MEEIYLYFAIVFGTRYSKKAKNLFLTMLHRRMKIAGYNERTFNNDYKKGKQLPDYVVYGNLKQAKIVFMSSYDTCSKMFIPNYLYYPLNDVKNSRFERINGIIELMLIVIAGCICALLLRFIGVDLSFKSIRTFYTLIPVIVFAIIIFTLMQGVTNSPNFNRNSAALILMYAIALETAVKKNAAFVFCNKSCSSREGYMRFSSECPETVRKKIILLNCIGAAEHLVLAHKEAESKRVEAIISNKSNMEIADLQLSESDAENSVLSLFPESLMLFGADESKGEYTVQNTRSSRDRIFDTVRLEELKALFLNAVS